jgi:hypothetical protein
MLLVVAMVAVSAQAQTTNPYLHQLALANPEITGPGGGAPAGWTGSADAFGNFTNADNANADGAISFPCWDANGILSQTLSVNAVAGATYTFSMQVCPTNPWANYHIPTFCGYSMSVSEGANTVAATCGIYSAFAGAVDPTNPHYQDWGYWYSVCPNNHFGTVTVSGVATGTGPLTITITPYADGILDRNDGNPNVPAGAGFQAWTAFQNATLTELDPPIPGDINGDGLVDVADYNIWAANVGKTGATWAQGDLNGDGLVDVADYNIWAANVGATVPTPEPMSMIILAIGGGLVALKRSSILRPQTEGRK